MPELKPVFYYVNTDDGKGVKTCEADSVVAWLYANKQDELAKQFSSLSHTAFDEMLEKTVKKALADGEIQISAAKTEYVDAPTSEAEVK